MSSDTGSRAMMVQVVSCIWLVMATLCIAARLFGRFVLLKNGGLDDAAVTISWAACIVNVVLVFYEVKHGMGKHIIEVAPPDLMENLFLWLAAIFYVISLTFVKVSIILQYLRFFVGHRIRLLAWLLLAFVIMCGIQVFFTSVFTCTPVSAFWGETEGRCINQVVIQFFNAGINILTDLLVLALPVKVVWGLQLPRRQKIGLMFVFGLGGFVCLVSILRLHALHVMTTSSNLTWDSAPVVTWSIVEGATGIICASLPAMRPFVSRLFPRLLSSTYAHQQPPISSHGRFRSIRDSKIYHGKSIQLTSIESSHQTSDRACDQSTGKNSKDVYVTTMTTQDVECAEDSASARDLIFKPPGGN
ncbi:PTH11-like integral membrane protein [Diplocarpon rosae]|nr:PTH11-like integral membrane protein [Diplocarpon rosae]